VRVTNWGAQRLYGRFGFRPVGVRKNYYQEINEDALIMWLDGIREPEFRAKLRELMQDVPDAVKPAGVRGAQGASADARALAPRDDNEAV
jgi:ribosomal-protein-alanine N-acetyltransferase